MEKRIAKAFFLLLTAGCAPYRWADLHNEILLPPTVEIREESNEGNVNLGILLHEKKVREEKSPSPFWYDDPRKELTVTRDGGGPFLYLKESLPLDLFLYKGGKSLIGEIRHYPLEDKIKHFSPGIGIGGLYDLETKFWPLLTLYFNFPFDQTNFFVAPRYFQTLVFTQLEWGDGNSYNYEEGVWKGEGWSFTSGLNHNFSRHVGTHLQLTTFDIRKGLKDVLWPEGDPRPHLVDRNFVDSSLSFSVYFRY